jgi:hypothetical protein
MFITIVINIVFISDADLIKITVVLQVLYLFQYKIWGPLSNSCWTEQILNKTVCSYKHYLKNIIL